MISGHILVSGLGGIRADISAKKGFLFYFNHYEL
jgi:hypothetical protein